MYNFLVSYRLGGDERGVGNRLCFFKSKLPTWEELENAKGRIEVYLLNKYKYKNVVVIITGFFRLK